MDGHVPAAFDSPRSASFRRIAARGRRTAPAGVLYGHSFAVKCAEKRVAFPALIGDKYMLEGRCLSITVCAAGASLGRDLNPGSRPYQGRALPLSYPGAFPATSEPVVTLSDPIRAETGPPSRGSGLGVFGFRASHAGHPRDLRGYAGRGCSPEHVTDLPTFRSQCC